MNLANFLVENSSGDGLRIDRGSVAAGGWRDEDYTTLPDHTIVIQNNNGQGVQISENSHFEVDSIRIEGNGEKGIDIWQNSSLEGGDKNSRSDHPDHMIIVRNNGDQGIEVGDSSLHQSEYSCHKSPRSWDST